MSMGVLHDSGTKNFAGDVGATWDELTALPDLQPGAFYMQIALSGVLAADDVLEISFWTAVGAPGVGGANLQIERIYTIAGPQVGVWKSSVHHNLNGMAWKARQTAGATGKSFYWEVVELAEST